MSLYNQYLKEKTQRNSLYEQYKKEQFLKSHPEITQAQQQAEQARQQAEEVNIPLETIKGLPSAAGEVGSAIWRGIKRIGGYLGQAVKHPVQTGVGAFEEAVFKPTIGVTRLVGKVIPAARRLAEREEAGLKEIEEQLTPNKQARAVGEFLGWMIPFTTTEKAIGAIPKLSKLGKLAPVVKELGAWISTDQLLYNPKTDGSRAKTALEDLAAFGVLKGASKLFRLAKGRFAVRVADETIKPVEQAMKQGEKIPLEEVETAVKKAKRIVKMGTGKEPKELVKEEVIPKIAPKLKPTLKPYIEQAKTAKNVEDLRDVIVGQGKAEEFSSLLRKAGIKNLGEFWNKVRPEKPVKIVPEAQKGVSEAITREKGIKIPPGVEKPKIEAIPKELEPLAKEAREFKSAEEFAHKLNIKIIPTRQYGRVGAQLKKYVDKDGKVVKAEIIVPKNANLSSSEMQSAIWHEIGHYLDEAKTIGGKGQLDSFFQEGKYSYPNRKILQKYADFILEGRKPPSIDIRIGNKKYKDIEDVLADKNLPDEIKNQIKDKYYTRLAKIESYLREDIELFAEGFSKFMSNPNIVKEKAPELYDIYSKVLKEKLPKFPIKEFVSKGVKEAKPKIKAYKAEIKKTPTGYYAVYIEGVAKGRPVGVLPQKTEEELRKAIKDLERNTGERIILVKPITKVTKTAVKGEFTKISGYPKLGDYVKTTWRGKTYEGKITGEKPVRFRTGYIAREIRTPEGTKKWMPWTSSAEYYVKRVEEKLPEFPAKEKSVELRAEIVPGAKAIANFINRDVIKNIKNKFSFLNKAKTLIVNWLNPPSDTEIKETTQIFLRQMKADVQQFKDQIWNTVDKRWKWWERVPEEIRLSFMDKIEKGEIEPKDFIGLNKEQTKTLSDIAKEYRVRLDRVYQQEKDYGDKIAYIENYFPHIWEKPKEAERFISSYIRKIGKPAFMKKRYYDFIKDGIKAGLKLKTTNPEELVVMREIGSYQYLKMREFLDKMKENGWLKFHRGLKRPPFGWKALDSNALKVYFPTEKGMVQAGEWIMPESAANVVNKYLSPSLWSGENWYNKVFRGFMRAKNSIVVIKLGFSAFHAIETTMSDLATNLTIALKKAGRGDIKGFLKTLAKTPFGPIESMRAGRIIEAWEKGPKTDWEKQAIDLIKRAGGRPRMSNVWRLRAKKRWMGAIDEFRVGNPIGATFRIIPDILEAIQKPILDWYVPRLKVSNFLRVAKDFIENHPDVPEKELDKYLTKLWDSIDNRFGQLVYDNLFWQRWIRDLGVSSSLSMGWNLGTFREFGGGTLDLAKLIGQVATKQGKKEITDRMLYSLTYPLVFGTLGGLITYISTGKRPQSLLDYFYPKTGNKNPDGPDERLQMPTMMKEFFASKSALQKYGVIKGPAIYLWHKTNPLFSIGLDILENKDFYGTEIRNENAPAVKQVKQLADYFTKEAIIPISFSAYLREKRILGKPTIKPFIGFVPAPKYITQTPIQSKIYTLYSKRFGGSVRTLEQKKKAQAKAEIRALYLQGKIKEANKKLKEAVKKGYIKQVKRFIEDSDLPSDIRAFRALPAEDQEGLISKMSLEEIKRYAWYAKKGVKSHFGKISPNAKTFVKLYKQGKIKKPVWKRGKLVK